MKIIGAGMAGCLAGVLHPQALIYEASGSLPDNHKAVLRFRGDTISKATGIPFRKVQVRKAIWFDGNEHLPTPRLCNFYSQKVSGRYMNRSINNIDPVERYIAPPDFHLLLAEFCKGRINFNTTLKEITKDTISIGDSRNEEIIGHRSRDKDDVIISTIPMPRLCQALRIPHEENFKFQPITVTRYKVPGADVFQTIYYPDPVSRIYRATMTGDDLIIESIGENEIGIEDQVVFESLGLGGETYRHRVGETHQQYGKIAPINEYVRKNIMLRATTEFRVYSLGRYACWRNILLDDVYDDIFKIRRMMNHHHYDLHLEATK